MLRKLLQAETGSLSDEEFNLVLDLATDDIRENRFRWGKMTSLTELAKIVKICVIVLNQIKKVAS